MEKPVHVLGFAGSLREGSYNRAALRAAHELLPPGMTLETFDLAPIPPYNADADAAGAPPSVQAFKERLAAADALLIVTPEYNGSLPGVLKNALDWASRPLQDTPLDGKPAAFMGAAPGMLGTVRAQLHLRQVCTAANMHPLNRPEVYIGQAAQKFDAHGRLTDEPTREWIGKLLAALGDWTRRLSPQEQWMNETNRIRGKEPVKDECRYTLDEAAAEVGFRADDLAAILPDAGIDLTAPGHEDGTLSEAELKRLADMADQIKQLHGGVYQGRSYNEGLV